MRRSRALICFALFTVPSSIAIVRADDPAPETVLKEKGLKRSGSVYFLASESEFQKKLAEVRGLYTKLSQAVMRKQMFEQNRQQADATVQELLRQRIYLNTQLSQATSAIENNRIVGMLRAVEDQATLIQRQNGDPEQNQAVGARVAMQREEYMQAVLDARQVVERAQENYALLGKDEDVAKALAALETKSKSRLELGPTKGFLANIKQLEKYEASVLTEKVALRKEGGIFWVDVMFNGKVTESLAFDTGAAWVVLPSELATKVGLNPGAEAPTVRTQIADGTVIDAKQMNIPSVRLGKFTVKDVPCIVMPAGKTNVPPLLGQTFLRHFMCHTNSDAGTLVLTKIDAEDKAETTAPKSKTASRATKGKRATAPNGTEDPER